MAAGYEATANALKDRIAALIPTHPEILTMKSPWDLFSIDEFDCRDLDPSMGQAMAALVAAQQDAERRR